MHYLSIPTAVLDSAEFVGEDPVNRASWLCLMRYCAGQENGGRITKAKEWGDRKWQQLIRITKPEADRLSSLWSWDGDDLVIHGYNNDLERIVQSRREAGRKGGQSKSEAKLKAVTSTLQSINQSKHQTKKERKKERKVIIPSAPAEQKEGGAVDPVPAKTPRPRNELLDTLATVGGGKAEEVPATAWSGAAKFLAEIKAVSPDVTPAEILRRAANYHTHFSVALTPQALAKWWARCAEPAANLFGSDEQAAVSGLDEKFKTF